MSQAVAGVRTPGLVLFFPTCRIPEPAAQAADAASCSVTAGMTVSAALTDAGPRLEGCAAIAFDESVPTGVGSSEHASDELAAAAFDATSAALAALPDSSPCGLVVLLSDTRSGDQADVLAGAYRAAGPRVPLAGGGAGGPEPLQFAGGRELRDSVIAIAVGATRPIGVGVADGCRAVGAPSIVTRAEGRLVLELDGRPAETVYLEKLAPPGEPWTDAEFERFAVLHPLAQPELSGDRRIRHVLGRGAGGGLYCATPVPAHAAVEFMVHDPERVVRSTTDAVRGALESLGGCPASAALVFDCAGRKRALDDELELEVETMCSGFGATLPVAGGYTHGEFARIRGAKGDRNHALVVVAIA